LIYFFGNPTYISPQLLKALIEKKLIENRPCAKDARVKKLIPTEKAMKLYKELGMLLIQDKKS